MPAFNHLQEVKNAIPLPVHPGEEIGVCLTCKYWQVEDTRMEAQSPLVAVCVQPELKDFALVLSGSSGCDKMAGRAQRQRRCPALRPPRRSGEATD